MTVDRDERGRWRAGRSANPAGRPPGTQTQRHIAQAIGPRLDELIERLLEQALQGDTSAARLILDRVSPALRPSDSAITLPSAETPQSAAQSALQAMARGELTPAQAGAVVAAARGVTEITDVADLAQRIERLEAQQS